MVAKIIDFIIFLYSENQLYSRRSIIDHCNELIGGIDHLFAAMEYHLQLLYLLTTFVLNFWAEHRAQKLKVIKTESPQNFRLR